MKVDGDHDILSLAKGGGVLAAGRLFAIISRFFIAYLLARYLGADQYGLYVLAISVGSIFAGFASLGLDRAMVRYVSILAARRDRPGLWGTIQVGLGMSSLLAIGLAVVLYLTAHTIATSLFDEPGFGNALRLMAFIMPFLTVSNMLTGIAYGFRRMGTAVIAENVVQTLVRLTLLIGIVQWSSLDLASALVAFGLSDVAATLALIVLLERVIPYDKESRLAVRRDSREILGFAIPLWLSGLLRQFRRNIEFLLLGTLSVASNVAVFAIASKINILGRVGYLSTLAAVKPIIAALSDQGDQRGLARIYTTATRWTFSFSVPFFVIIVFLRKPILEVFGPDFVAGSSALMVLAAAELVNSGTGICQSLIDMTGHAKLKLANSVGWLILQVGGGALLIPRWGVVGAAAATFLAVTAVNVATVFQMLVLERLWPYDRSFWKPIAAGLGTAGAGLVLVYGIPLSAGIVSVLAKATVMTAIYAGLLIVFRLEPDDRIVLDRLKRKLRSGRSSTADQAVSTS